MSTPRRADAAGVQRFRDAGKGGDTGSADCCHDGKDVGGKPVGFGHLCSTAECGGAPTFLGFTSRFPCAFRCASAVSRPNRPDDSGGSWPALFQAGEPNERCRDLAKAHDVLRTAHRQQLAIAPEVGGARRQASPWSGSCAPRRGRSARGAATPPSITHAARPRHGARQSSSTPDQVTKLRCSSEILLSSTVRSFSFSSPETGCTRVGEPAPRGDACSIEYAFGEAGRDCDVRKVHAVAYVEIDRHAADDVGLLAREATLLQKLDHVEERVARREE